MPSGPGDLSGFISKIAFLIYFLIKIILIYLYLNSLLENNIFFHFSICHIGKQIDIWRIKFIEPFRDALST